MDCKFNMGARCAIITSPYDCATCSFKKTQAEYDAGVHEAEEILRKKHLTKCTRLNENGVAIVSVKEIY